jgi:hypothetical protein
MRDNDGLCHCGGRLDNHNLVCSEGVPMTIKKYRKGYRVYSRTGKNLGTFSNKADALRRLRQVEYFKKKKQHKTVRWF